MYKVDREKQIKLIMNRLEQLVLKAEKERMEAFEITQHDPSMEPLDELDVAEAYEDGVFAAYAIVRKIVEGDYE